MPTELGKPYSPTWRGRPPHMLRPDFPVWGRFLDKYAHSIDVIYYDVRVGNAGMATGDVDEKMAKMYRAVTAKRIDALVEYETELWLVEVAAGPGLRSLGQLATYLALYAQDPKISKPTLAYLVCDSLDPDIRAALRLYSMHFIEV